MKTVNIAHIASHHINVGDGAIHAGTYTILREIASDLGININVRAMDSVPASYSDGRIDLKKTADDCDIVMIGGGGVIDGYNKQDGAAIGYPISNQQIKESKKHIFFLALGHNLFYGQQMENDHMIRDLLKICENKNYGFSVRRDGSFSRLANDLRDSADVRNVTVVPDPGMFIDVEQVEYPYVNHPARRRPLIILQISSEKYDMRFGNERMTEKYFVAIAQLVRSMANDYNILLAAHTLNDVYSVGSLMTKLDQRGMRHSVGMTGIYHPMYADIFFKNYAAANLVIGMRGHSAICAYGLGCNLIAVDTHPKVRGFMEDYDMNDRCFSPYEVVNDIGFVDTVETLAQEPANQLDRTEKLVSERAILKQHLLGEVEKVL